MLLRRAGTPLAGIISDQELADFAKAALLTIEQAEELLRESQQFGWQPEILACMGAMAIDLVEADRRQFIRLPNKLDRDNP
jgi:hypothetical protein